MATAPPTHYSVLGVDEKATHKQITKAYRQALLDAHFSGADTGPLKQAFAVLTNDIERIKYNKKLFRAKLAERQAPSMFQDLDLDEDSLASTHRQLKRGMTRQKLKTIDLFRQIDGDGSGKVNAAEFARALAELGLNIPTEAMAQIFKNFDRDGSGYVDYEELKSTLNQRGSLLVDELSDEMRAAMGLPPRYVEPEEEEEEPERRTAVGNWKYAAGVAKAENMFRNMKRASSLQPLPFRAISIGRGAEAFDAWEFAFDAQMNNRGASQLAIVTHPLMLGVNGDGDTVEQCMRQRPMHHALVKGGWNVLAYEACGLGQDGTGEVEAARLREAMDYVKTHRKFRYCKVALVTQGTGASAAFKALAENPEKFDYVVRSISACQPSGMDELMEAVVNDYAPKCKLPVILSHAPVSMSSGGVGVDGRPRLRPMTPATIKVGRAIPEETPTQTLDVWNYPLRGPSKRFEGTRYFGDHPTKLIGFLDENARPPPRRRKVGKTLAPSASAPTMMLRSAIAQTSSLTTAVSAARLAVAGRDGALVEEGGDA